MLALENTIDVPAMDLPTNSLPKSQFNAVFIKFYKAFYMSISAML